MLIDNSIYNTNSPSLSLFHTHTHTHTQTHTNELEGLQGNITCHLLSTLMCTFLFTQSLQLCTTFLLTLHMTRSCIHLFFKYIISCKYEVASKKRHNKKHNVSKEINKIIMIKRAIPRETKMKVYIYT